MKNREAAQQFRMRQKKYIQDLEKKIEELRAENAAHKMKLELVNSENRLIKDQLMYLRNFIGKAVQVTLENYPEAKKLASQSQDPAQS